MQNKVNRIKNLMTSARSQILHRKLPIDKKMFFFQLCLFSINVPSDIYVGKLGIFIKVQEIL